MMHWIFPAKWGAFDVLSAFAILHELDWRKNCKAGVGDVVFIYLGEQVGKIVLKTIVMKDDLPNVEIDDRRFFKGTKRERMT